MFGVISPPRDLLPLNNNNNNARAGERVRRCLVLLLLFNLNIIPWTRSLAAKNNNYINIHPLAAKNNNYINTRVVMLRLDLSEYNNNDNNY